MLLILNRPLRLPETWSLNLVFYMVEKSVATKILPACSAADFCGLRTTIHITKEITSPCGKGLKDKKVIVLKLLHSEVMSDKGNNEKWL